MSIAGWPLIHIASGLDAATLRPRVARGLIAIGNIALGGVAIGGVSFGVLSFGGVSVGLLGALGGQRCDPAAVEFFSRWLSSLPPRCG